MRVLFGPKNFHSGSDRMFKGTFNSQMEGKKLVYCDEILIKNKEEEDKIKLVVNDVVEIERKGKDVKQVKNFANFYVSSNNLDSISLTADDRRFSIVNLTDKKLLDVLDSDSINSLLEEENINNLGCYLWYRHYDKESILRVFKSARTEEVRDSSLKEWEEWFLFNYCVNNVDKEIKVFDAGTAVKEHFGYSVKIGRGRFIDLSARYPGYFIVKKNGQKKAQQWVIQVTLKNCDVE
jgi:hypothetical protein